MSKMTRTEASLFSEDPTFYLRKEYSLRLTRRPYYSMRAFARDLGLSPSSLSDFLKGKMGFTQGRALLLAKKIGLSSEEADHWIDVLEMHYGRSTEDRKLAKGRVRGRVRDRQSQMSLDRFRIVADWYHFALLELIGIRGPLLDEKSAARQLGILVGEVHRSLKRLEAVGLLAKTAEGWQVQENTSFVGNHTPQAAIKQYHMQMMGKAQEALETQSLEEREFNSVIFSINKKDLDKFRSELRAVVFDVLNKYAVRTDKDAVYGISYQVFNMLKEKV